MVGRRRRAAGGTRALPVPRYSQKTSRTAAARRSIAAMPCAARRRKCTARIPRQWPAGSPEARHLTRPCRRTCTNRLIAGNHSPTPSLSHPRPKQRFPAKVQRGRFCRVQDADPFRRRPSRAPPDAGPAPLRTAGPQRGERQCQRPPWRARSAAARCAEALRAPWPGRGRDRRRAAERAFFARRPAGL